MPAKKLKVDPGYNAVTRKIADLKPYENNSRTHSEEQVAQIAASIEKWGFTNPVLIDPDGGVIAGHGRLLAAQVLNLTEVPCVVADGWSEADTRAYVIADNALALNAGWDMDLLKLEFDFLAGEDFDLDLIGFDMDELNFEDATKQKHTPLSETFGAPPFTVFDTKQGYWKARRDAWLGMTGDLTETKEGVLGGTDTLLGSINDGSSNFDPVLAELCMRWFSPEGGKVLDPFGGEQTKGVVAGVLGRQYSAVEFRQEQVDVNNAACKAYKNVKYACGDSEHISDLIKVRNFDLCFTSPPYYDLEIYSKEDMSAFGTYDEFMAKYRLIFEQCYRMLAKDAFLVIKIGEIRDKKTGAYRNFVGDNISMFLDIGFSYYNEAVLLNSFGTAPQRAGKAMGSRKLVKVHQNVLVFVKGDAKAAAAKCGEITAVEFGQPDV